LAFWFTAATRKAVASGSATRNTSRADFENPDLESCIDTGFVKVSFQEEPSCNAGDFNDPCGTVDTLHATTVFGGYWEVEVYNGSGINCSAIFSNQETGLPDIYDPNAIVTVSCEGEWIFTWHEVNGQCESECDVVINFLPSSININTLLEGRTCFDYAQVHVDTTGFSDDTWFWMVDPEWDNINQYPVTFNPFDPMAIVYRDFPISAFGEAGFVEVPMIVSLIKDGCASTETSSVSFYQRPQPFIGRDTAVCDNEIHYNVLATIPTSVSSQQWYGTGFGGVYTASPVDAYISTISAPFGSDLYIVFSEENTLGNNHPSCLVKDSMFVEFLKTPTPDAGDDETNICGNCVQLDAHLDNSMNSVGRWELTPQGQFGYSCGDNNAEAVADSNAWFYHATDDDYGKDVIDLVWREHNAKSAQCFATDTVPVTFWFKDTAEITLSINNSLEDAICGRKYSNISANSNMPSNPDSRGTWHTIGNPVEWFKDGLSGAYNEPLLDFIRVNSIGEQASVTKEIYWVIENGRIFGDDVPAVCVDTSEIVTIRFDNEVEANIITGQQFPELTSNCGNTICLDATFEKAWTHFQWGPNDYAYYNETYDGSRADTLSSSCLIAPQNIYPNSDTVGNGLNTHQTIILDAFNGTCLDRDTINVIFAPIPSATIIKVWPRCVGDSATLSIKRDYATGLDRYIESVNWFWEEDDEPTHIIPHNETQDAIAVYWGNSIENNDFKHAVSVETVNYWGCSFRSNPPDTVVEPNPAYVQWTDDEYPTCGECDGELIFKNYSNEYPSPTEYSIEWANNIDFNNSADNIIDPDSAILLNNLCASEYYVLVSYSSDFGGNCYDTLYFDLHADESTIATSNFEFLTDTSDLQAPFTLDITSLSNTSLNATKYTWQVFNGTEEDLSMLVYEGNDEIPNYVFSNMGEYLIKLQSFNDKAPNCPANPVDMNIFVHYESVIEVPNIFTPNEDGINDEFTIKTRELTAYQCIIYNRWGQKIFESSDENESWDGTMKNNGDSKVAPGSYYYIITGKGKKGQDFEFKGAVQVVTENK
jgi:gliding motility-associated-like protein